MDNKILVLFGLVAIIGFVSASYPRPQSHYRTPPAPHYQPTQYRGNTPSYRPSPSQYTPRQQRYYKREWGYWGQWSRCSRTCGGGEQRRYRTCRTTTHYGYGQQRSSGSCHGSSSATRRCNTQCCRVEGGWGYWSNWASSGHSYTHRRTRTCSRPYPRCGGRCYGDDSQTKTVHPPPSYRPTSYRPASYRPTSYRPTSYREPSYGPTYTTRRPTYYRPTAPHYNTQSHSNTRY